MNIYLKIISSCLIGYLLGCIHPSYILGKAIKNIDIRKYGSNNSGASNSAIVLGLKYGILTGAIDIFKGFLAPLITYLVISNTNEFMCLGGMCAVMGHMFPFYLNFKGGKGLASMVGFSLCVNPLLGIGICVVIIIVAFSTDYIVLGTVSAAICFLIYGIIKFGISYELLFIALSVSLILYKHRANYTRILNKTEAKVSDTLKIKKHT